MAGDDNILRTIAAGAQSGGAGLALFGLDMSGQIWCCWQDAPGGNWSQWDGPGFQSQSTTATQIAVAGQNDGSLLLVMLDTKGFVWTCAQNGPSGNWGAWQGPGLSNQVYAWQTIAAGESSGVCGTELWVTDYDGQIWTAWQTTPAGSWTDWSGPGFNGQSFKAFACASAGQNNGALSLFAMDGSSTIWVTLQQGPSGNWNPWQGPSVDNQSVPLDAPCAAEQGGNRGVQFWALDQNSQIWTLYQDTPGGQWDGWFGPDFVNQPVSFTQLAAAGQGNGCTLLIGLSPIGQLFTIGQLSPGGDWGTWQQMAPPGD